MSDYIKRIKITGARDHLMWYSDKIGQTVDVEREDGDYYWCREDAGFINIVHKADAEETI